MCWTSQLWHRYRTCTETRAYSITFCMHDSIAHNKLPANKFQIQSKTKTKFWMHTTLSQMNCNISTEMETTYDVDAIEFRHYTFFSSSQRQKLNRAPCIAVSNFPSLWCAWPHWNGVSSSSTFKMWESAVLARSKRVQSVNKTADDKLSYTQHSHTHTNERAKENS